MFWDIAHHWGLYPTQNVALLFPKVINWDLVLRGAILAPFQDLVWYRFLRPPGVGRGGEGRECLLPWLREIRVSSACWKLGFHEGLLHWLSFAISGAAIAILVQGKRDFQALNATGGAFSNLGVGRVWI
jgi:hypothetical protein